MTSRIFSSIKQFFLSIPMVMRNLILSFFLIWLCLTISTTFKGWVFSSLVLHNQEFWKHPWQLVTDPFIHFGFPVLLLVSFCLYNCLPAERTLGSRRFAFWMALATFLSTITSALLGFLISSYNPHVASMPMGLFSLALMTRLWKNRQVLFWAIPNPISAQWIFFFLIIASLLEVVSKQGWIHLVALLPALGIGFFAPISGAPTLFSSFSLGQLIRKNSFPTKRSKKTHLREVPLRNP